MKKIEQIMISAVLLFIITALVSCAVSPLEPSGSNSGEDVTTAELTEAQAFISLSGYKVVRPTKASGEVITATVALKNRLEAQAENITISDDWVRSEDEITAQALEILVGTTNRPESTEAAGGLLVDDFAVKYFAESGRIVICGGSDAATVRAIDHFMEYCLNDGRVESTLSFFSASQYVVDACMLCGKRIDEYTVVFPNKADADEKYAAELIIGRVREMTGVSLSSVRDTAAADGARILIGNTSATPAGFTTLGSSADGYVLGRSGEDILLCGEGGTVVKAARRMLDMLFVEGESRVSLELPEASIIAAEVRSLPELSDFGSKPIALADQLNASLAVYDLSSGGEPILKYEFKPQKSNGFSLNGYGNRIDEVRLRYSEKWQSYIILFTSSSGYVGIAGYPSEKCLWEVELKGTSPHSIEYLPNGTVAVASSGGEDTKKGFVRLYATENCRGNDRYAEARLTSAHAVLWDDTREILWAMGSTEIVAYEVGGDPSAPSLTRIAAYGTSEMKGGHDLSALCGDDDRVWVGGAVVRIFDKTTGALIAKYAGAEQIESGNVKCICSFPDGDAVRTVATKVYADHNTDRFVLYEFGADGALAREYVFDGRAFYKARAFLAAYN